MFSKADLEHRPPSPFADSGNVSSRLPVFAASSGPLGLFRSSEGIAIGEAESSDGPIPAFGQGESKRTKREDGQREDASSPATGSRDLPRWRILQQEVRSVGKWACALLFVYAFEFLSSPFLLRQF